MPHPKLGTAKRCYLLLLAAAFLIASEPAWGGPQTRPAPSRTWQSTDGRFIDPLANLKRPTVLVFLLTDCPIANLYAPELIRMSADYGSKVSFVMVYVDEGLTPDLARRHAKDFGLTGTTLLDPTHSLAKRVGATASPEAAVFDAKGRMVYRGRVDDRHVDYDQERPQPKRRDLRLALNSVLAGKRVEISRTKVVGCVFRKASNAVGR